MIRKLIVGITAGWIAAAGLPAGALAEQPPSPELAKEIQARLFDLGYVVWPDGNWDDRTKAAIRSWHQITKRPLSDVMSDDDVAYLRAAIPPKPWGGVVYDAKGHYRLFVNEATRKELVDKELSYCKEAGYEAKQCRLDLILNNTMVNSCSGISHGEWKDGPTTHDTSSTVRRVDIKTASDDAVNECAKTAPRDNCKLLAAVCADGSSLTGALENKP